MLQRHVSYHWTTSQERLTVNGPQSTVNKEPRGTAVGPYTDCQPLTNGYSTKSFRWYEARESVRVWKLSQPSGISFEVRPR